MKSPLSGSFLADEDGEITAEGKAGQGRFVASRRMDRCNVAIVIDGEKRQKSVAAIAGGGDVILTRILVFTLQECIHAHSSQRHRHGLHRPA